jgi:hypothetical protein
MRLPTPSEWWKLSLHLLFDWIAKFRASDRARHIGAQGTRVGVEDDLVSIAVHPIADIIVGSGVVA